MSEEMIHESAEGVTEDTSINPAYLSDDELYNAVTEGVEDEESGPESQQGASEEKGTEQVQAAPATDTPESYTPQQVQQLIADREKHQRMIAQQEQFIQR